MSFNLNFEQRWKRAGEPQTGDWDPPDGNYTVQIVEAEAFESKDGREFVKVTLEVVGGDHEGRRFEDFNGLVHEVGARTARENLSVYGLNVDEVKDFEDLAVRIGELVAGHAEVVVSHSSKGYLNVKATNGKPANPHADVEPDTAGLAGDDPPF